jgi:2-polyprenyl-3-methyl-5-hydroxy-6-metoxy-1,4-benzoquinol methylase
MQSARAKAYRMWDAFKRRAKRYLGIGDPILLPERRGSADTDAAVRYLLNEVSDLRILARELAARAATRTADVIHTQQSFSYQWEQIGAGQHLLGDPHFEREMPTLISRYAELPLGWFADKSVLDAGCGNGRWSLALARLGARVTAIDQSRSVIAELERRWSSLPNLIPRQADVLEPLPFKAEFDLVWCFGVAHHTGNTRLAVEHVAAAVRPGGRLFLMIYGEPRSEMEFNEINGYVQLRRATRFMNFEERHAYLETRFPKHLVHGYFDAVSPTINDLHRLDEVESWLREAGLHNVRTTLDSRNHLSQCRMRIRSMMAASARVVRISTACPGLRHDH